MYTSAKTHLTKARRKVFLFFRNYNIMLDLYSRSTWQHPKYNIDLTTLPKCYITGPVLLLLYLTYNGFIKTVICHYQYLKAAYKLCFADILVFPHLGSD